MESDPLLHLALSIQADRRLAYWPTPGQERFHKSARRLRALIAANRVGKTLSGAMEIWWQAAGDHPWRQIRRKQGSAWIVCGTWGGPYRAVAKALWASCPTHLVDWTKTKYFEHGHWQNHRITMLDGYVIQFLSSKGSSVASASGSCDYLWIDEPPKPHQWSELLARTADVGGPVSLTCTPIDSEQDLDWLRIILEGDEESGVQPSGDWDVGRITYSPENVPWRTPEEITEQVALYSPWEYEQRVMGGWHGNTATRWMHALDESVIFDDHKKLPPMQSFGLGLDHGHGPGKEVAILVGWDGKTLWILGEYINASHTHPTEDAEGIKKLIESWGLTLSDVKKAVGDVNSLGKSGGGASVNETLEDCFARLNNSTRPPFAISVPRKGPGSIERGVRAMNNAMRGGHLKIHEGCKILLKSMQRWQGKPTDPAKDAIDGFRYIGMEYLGDSSPEQAKVRLY